MSVPSRRSIVELARHGKHRPGETAGTTIDVADAERKARHRTMWGKPLVEPNGPENVPVWRFDTRRGASSGRQSGWSASIRRRRPFPGTASLRPADRSGVVQCGR